MQMFKKKPETLRIDHVRDKEERDEDKAQPCFCWYGEDNERFISTGRTAGLDQWARAHV